MDDTSVTANLATAVEASSQNRNASPAWASETEQATAFNSRNHQVRRRRRPDARVAIERRFTRMNEEHDRIRSRELALRLATQEIKRKLIV